MVIPKIYIKKPPVSKELLPPHISSGPKEPPKIEEKPTENKEKIEETVVREKPNGVEEPPKPESM